MKMYWGGMAFRMIHDAPARCGGGERKEGNVTTQQRVPFDFEIDFSNGGRREHLCGLARLPDTGFRFFAVPVKVRRFGTFPVRAFAVI